MVGEVVVLRRPLGITLVVMVPLVVSGVPVVVSGVSVVPVVVMVTGEC